MAAIPSAGLLASAIAGRGTIVQFTVDDAMAMLRQGLLADDCSTELLNGYIVHTDRSQFGGDPTMMSPGHRRAVRRLSSLISVIDCAERTVQIQSSIVCGLRQMPEPDFAIVRGSDDAYKDALPTGDDVECIIEVADSSLERDRGEKLPIHASANVPQYIILNLRNRTAEVYANPDPKAGTYLPPVIVDIHGSIAIRLSNSNTLAVPLANLLS